MIFQTRSRSLLHLSAKFVYFFAKCSERFFVEPLSLIVQLRIWVQAQMSFPLGMVETSFMQCYNIPEFEIY